jgi:cobalt-precorrin 5A hydrolase
MIRIFHTASGIKKISGDSVFKVRNAAFIIISQNSLEMALDICKGIAPGGKEAGPSGILYFFNFFIEKEKKELIDRAQKHIAKNAKINISLDYYEKLSAIFLGRLFKEFDCIVFFMALGATVRLIAPFIKDKLKDPCVVAIDEAGKFVVSVLSGHTGGANKFAVRVSEFLSAVPVITTATDVTGRFSLDMFAEKFGFFIEDAKNKIKEFNKASLRGEKFKIYVDTNDNNFDAEEILTYINVNGFDNVKYFDSNPHKAIVVSMRIPAFAGMAPKARNDLEKLYCPGNISILRPKRIVVGIGCNKNTGFEEIEDFILSKFAEHNLSINALRNLATIDLKEGEKGILQFGEKYAEFIDFFTKEEINSLANYSGKNDKNEKSLCFKHTGAYSVCEPCAVLSAKNKTAELLIHKQKKGNVTMSVAVAKGENK